MLRPTLASAGTLVGALTLATTAAGQTPRSLNPDPVVGPIKDAGIYHLATGTWTRSRDQVANFGVQEIIYSNTAGSGYFTAAGGAGGFGAGAQNFDEGGLPGPGNGTLTSMSGAALRPVYEVDGFQIGYCDQGAAGSSGWELSFYSEYDPCTLAASAPSSTIFVAGLPAGGCWTVTFDLSAATGAGQEFCLSADGNFGTWDNDIDDDTFGWSYRYAGTDGTAAAGFLLAGDPKYTDANWTSGAPPTDGSNTYYGQTMSGCAGTGTGYITRDFWWLEDSHPSGVLTRCYFFGGYVNRNGCGGPQGRPLASFWMEMYGETACTGGPGGPFCLSNPNSTGLASDILFQGSAVAADDDVLMTAINLPTNTFGFFITSRSQGNPFTPPNSQGFVCLAGDIGRFIGPGQLKNSGATGEISLDTNLGEWTLSSIPSSMGNYAAMTGVTSNFQLWHRDALGGQATSNFSNAYAVTWQ